MREKVHKSLLLIIFFSVTFVILIIGIFGIVLMLKDEPPLVEVKNARKGILAAKNLKADIYAEVLFRKSEKLYDSAMISWRTENKKFILKRDYSRIKSYALLSIKLANEARDGAISVKSELKTELEKKIDSLKWEIDNFYPVFSRMPLQESTWKMNSKGNLLLSEAQSAFAMGHFVLCEEKIEESIHYISNAYQDARNLLKDYFVNYPVWQEWARGTVENSEQSKINAIIVDKFSRQLLVYHNGTLKYTFEIELGQNWIGDKRHKGDKATPEGYYKVIDRKENSSTKYYKALLLDYPNEDDKQHFINEKKNGTLHRLTEIGGSIEIHGQGGKGIDWTDGCIALKDSDMDMVYKNSPPGTMVTIVGSLKPLEEILKK